MVWISIGSFCSVLPGLGCLFPSPGWKSFQPLFLQKDFLSLSLSLSLWDSYDVNVVHFMTSQTSLMLSSIGWFPHWSETTWFFSIICSDVDFFSCIFILASVIFFSSGRFFLKYFLSLCWSFHQVYLFACSLISIFVTSTWTFHLLDSLFLFILFIFLGFCLFLGTCSLSPHFTCWFASKYYLGQLYLLVVKYWQYLEGVLWGLGMKSPKSPVSDAPEVFPVWTSVSSCCGWATAAMTHWTWLIVRPGCNCCWCSGQAFSMAVHLCVARLSLDYFRHSTVYWCWLRFLTRCGSAVTTFKGRHFGDFLRETPGLGKQC